MIKLISTDFDGTIHDHHSSTLSIAPEFLQFIADAQKKGTKWVINTGRMLSDVRSTIDSGEMLTHPDYIISVEREIHRRHENDYVSHEEWNLTCHKEHQELFKTSHQSIDKIRRWLSSNFKVQIYEDPWSPLCLIASHLDEADRIHNGVLENLDPVPGLSLVRNSIYFRFAHESYSKGTALAEIGRLLGINKSEIFAAGDSYNDTSMLDGSYAKWIAAPSNAIPEVKDLVKKSGGYLAERPYAYGVLDALKHFTKQPKKSKTKNNA